MQVGLCGSYLCLSASLPEEKGKVVARSFGRNPEWEKDALESPPVEDRVEYVLQDSRRTLKLAINSWGAYRLESDGKPVGNIKLSTAALIDTKGWTVEAAVPLNAIGMSDAGVQVARIRSRRPLSPEMKWFYSGSIALKSSAQGTPDFRPPALGNTDAPLEIGRMQKLPPMPDYLDPSQPDWNHPAWQAVRSFSLPRNEPNPRQPRYPTEVKWVHDGSTLALLIRASEPEPVVANAGGRDAPIDSGDHIAIRLATDGAALLEILVNPVGAIRDRRARDFRTLRSGGSTWNADIQVRTRIEHGAWIVRIDMPLKECAEALGEASIPVEWRALVSRYRAPRSGEAAEISALPPVGSETLLGPIRYRRTILLDELPSSVAMPGVSSPPPQSALARELAALDSRVWTDFYRRHKAVRNMVRNHQQKRAEQAILEERRAWDSIRSRDDWEQFRLERLRHLRRSVGQFPTEAPPLDVRISGTYSGRGYQLQNLVYQSRPGFYVSANLYRPEGASRPMPAIVIMHSFHYPKTQGELHDMGEMWARTGTAVLIPERVGFGERVETTPLHRQAYASRFTFRKQLGLIGDSFIGWMAWDLIRAVDLLIERSDIDPKRIIMIGAVAGGNEPAAVAAALDERIAAVVPYNYDHGRVRLDADFPGELTRRINMSFVTASVAPRRYIRAFEFGWEGAAQPDFPDLWVDAWERSKKVWKFYDAPQNLATIQAYGLIRLSMERVSHCFSVGPQHRAELHPVLQRWFGIPIPSRDDLSILPDSELSVNPYREEARRQEALRRRPHSELVSFTPALSSKVPRRLLHQVAHDRGQELLGAAPNRNRESLRRDLADKLGDIEPRGTDKVNKIRTQDLRGIHVEALSLEVEEGILVPVMLLRPVGKGPIPIVIGITAGGKDRFLTGRAEATEKLLGEGIAVCLPDLRGIGETAPEPDWLNQGAGMSETELALGNTLLGARLKDLRTVLRYIRSRSEFDSRRLALWGDGFAPTNPRPLFLDELELEGGPQIQYHSEPMGALLALLGALYEDVPVVAAQHGLSSYLSVLGDSFTYTPADVLVHGILRVADVADVAAALAPRHLLLNAMVNGRNEALSTGELQTEFAAVRNAYTRSGAANRVRIEAVPEDPAAWLASALKTQHHERTLE